MPIRLDAIGRRDFLRQAVTAVGGAVCLSTARAADGAGKGDFIALFSDTHIAAKRDTIMGKVNMAENLARAGKEVLALERKPDYVLINGDCAHLTGQAGDYRSFVEVCQPIREGGIPLVMTLGNHDARDAFFEVVDKDGESHSAVQDKYVGTLETNHVNWFLLDSLQVVNATSGTLGEAQLAWLDKSLGEKSDKPAFVMAHHNTGYSKVMDNCEVVVDVADKRIPVPGVTDQDALFEILKRHPHVSAYICGHTHQWNVLRWEGITLVNLPPVAYTFTPPDPNGWVTCSHSPDGTELELRAFDSLHKYAGKKVSIPYRGA